MSSRRATSVALLMAAAVGATRTSAQEPFEPSMLWIAEVGPMVQFDEVGRNDSRGYLGLEVGALRRYHPDAALGLVLRNGRIESDLLPIGLEARFRRYVTPDFGLDFGAGLGRGGPAFTTGIAHDDRWSARIHGDLFDEHSGAHWVWTGSMGINAGEAGAMTVVGAVALTFLFDAFLRFADSARDTS